MPTHLHLLIFLDGKHLASFMRDLKKYVAQKVAPDLGLLDSPLWEQRYDRVAIFSDDIFHTKLSYIHNNPVKADLSNQPEEWYWSSASDYMTDRVGLIPVWKNWV